MSVPKFHEFMKPFVETIKEVKSRNEVNKVEVVTEEMEADMEEGVMNEYYSRF